jgi:alkanesulfonate monooxygenase SsuD/methylene tetrahydromethanopterin reductase-like flavin-dependent oxidoreductase (luciferase family)
MAYPYTLQERAAIREYRDLHIVGSPAAVRARIEALLEEVEVEEVMISSMIHSQEARLRSYELVAEAFGLKGT